MFNLKSAIWLCVFVLTSVSQIASAQSYYPNNSYPVYNGYNNSGYNGYNNPGYGGYNNSGYNGYNNPGYAGNNNSGYSGSGNSGYGGYNSYNNAPQSSYNYPQQNYNPYYNQQQPAYGYAQPAYPQNYYSMPRYNNGYRNNSNGFNRMFKGNKFGGGRNFGEELWPGRGSIYEDALPVHGPWDRNWGKAPWNRDYENLWEPEGGPDKWFDFGDPKEGLANAWEDMLYTPNALGTMPGGWKAPSVSVPNPIDVGDEFKNAARDMPDEMQNFSEGFTYGDDGYNDNPNKGQFGAGNNKKKGINIAPKVR
jgi:hypothetical protein